MPRYCCEVHAKRHGHVFANLPAEHCVRFGGCAENEGAPTPGGASKGVAWPAWSDAVLNQADLEEEVMELRAQVKVLQNWMARAQSLGYDPDTRDRPGAGHGGLA